MFKEKIFRFPTFAAVCGILAFFCRYTGLFVGKIGNASSFIFLPLVVAVAIYYGEITAMFYGLGIGLLADTVASGSYCFNTLFLCFAGLVVGVLSEYVFNRNLQAAAALSVITAFIYFGLKWVFFFFFPDVQGKMFFLLQYCLPSAFFTSVLIVPIYFAEKFLADKYKNKNKINNI